MQRRSAGFGEGGLQQCEAQVLLLWVHARRQLASEGFDGLQVCRHLRGAALKQNNLRADLWITLGSR